MNPFICNLLFGARRLVGYSYLPPLFGRLQNGQTHLQSCFAPSPIMKDGPIVHHCLIEFVNFGFPSDSSRRKSYFSFLFIPIDNESIWRLANIALLAGDQRETEEGLFSLTLGSMTELPLPPCQGH